jgi:Peptidase family M28
VQTTVTDAATTTRALERTLSWIRLLSSEIGPRRPTGLAERLAAERMRAELGSAGLPVELEPFRGYSSFFHPYAVILGAAVLAGVLPRRHGRLRTLVAAAAAAGLVTEGGLVHTPLSSLLSRRPSQNVVGAIDPRGEARRTLCLVCHLDTSRSGLMFQPRVVRHLNRIISLQSAAVLAQAGEPLLSGLRPGRALLAIARIAIAAGLALLGERELRGVDVPGASDNASGAAVAAQLAAECAAERPGGTRVVLLMTGCEESGLLGAQAFLRSRDTSGWLFLNFDSIGGPATLRFLEREGVIAKWDADARLIALAARVAERRPELGLAPTDRPAGLTYDISPVLARGGRALTFSAQDDTIPNLHLPSDTHENVDPDVIGRALAVGREMIAAIDRGEAD